MTKWIAKYKWYNLITLKFEFNWENEYITRYAVAASGNWATRHDINLIYANYDAGWIRFDQCQILYRGPNFCCFVRCTWTTPRTDFSAIYDSNHDQIIEIYYLLYLMLKENKYMFSFNLNYIFALNVEWKSVQFNTWLKVMNRPPDVRLDLWYKCYRRFFS